MVNFARQMGFFDQNRRKKDILFGRDFEQTLSSTNRFWKTRIHYKLLVLYGSPYKAYGDYTFSPVPKIFSIFSRYFLREKDHSRKSLIDCQIWVIHGDREMFELQIDKKIDALRLEIIDQLWFYWRTRKPLVKYIHPNRHSHPIQSPQPGVDVWRVSSSH